MYYFIPISLETEFEQYIQQWITVEQGWTIITGVYSVNGGEKRGDSIIKNYLPNGQEVTIPNSVNINDKILYIVGFSLEANLTSYPNYENLLEQFGVKGFEQATDYLEFINNL
jgi:hypothetical protein